jgi:hypothetical protein
VKCNMIAVAILMRNLVNGYSCLCVCVCVDVTETRLLEYAKLFLTHLKLQFFFYGNLCKDVGFFEYLVLDIMKVVVDGETASFALYRMQWRWGKCVKRSSEVGTEALLLPSRMEEGSEPIKGTNYRRIYYLLICVSQQVRKTLFWEKSVYSQAEMREVQIVSDYQMGQEALSLTSRRSNIRAKVSRASSLNPT